MKRTVNYNLLTAFSFLLFFIVMAILIDTLYQYRVGNVAMLGAESGPSSTNIDELSRDSVNTPS